MLKLMVLHISAAPNAAIISVKIISMTFLGKLISVSITVKTAHQSAASATKPPLTTELLSNTSQLKFNVGNALNMDVKGDVKRHFFYLRLQLQQIDQSYQSQANLAFSCK